jgi:hypothetical protein
VPVEPEGEIRLSALGLEGSGRTTYAGMLYSLLRAGGFPDLAFAWSDSLREFEAIHASLHRPLERGGPSFPPRASRATALHLAVRRRVDDRSVDLTFPDLRGDPGSAASLPETQGHLVFVDATSVGMAAIGGAHALFQALLDRERTKWLEKPVAVVLSKWDAIGAGVSPDAFVRTKLGGLREFWEGHLAHYRVFGVSAVGSARSVPAPEPCEEAPGLRYRPRNLTRPIAWLLEELAGSRPAAAP